MGLVCLGTMFAGLILSIAPASAQTPSPSAPVTLPSAAPTLPLTSPTATQLASANRLVDLLNVTQPMETMLMQMMPVLTRAVVGSIRSDPSAAPVAERLNQPGEQDRFERITAEEFMRSMHDHMGDVRRDTARAYAERFSQAELDGLVAFYSSPIGRHVVALQPDLQRVMSQNGEVVGRQAAREAMPRVISRFVSHDGPAHPAT